MSSKKLQKRIAYSNVQFAREIITNAMKVLRAQQLLNQHKIPYAPDLLPVVEHLLIDANSKFLSVAEKELAHNDD